MLVGFKWDSRGEVPYGASKYKYTGWRGHIACKGMGTAVAIT